MARLMHSKLSRSAAKSATYQANHSQNQVACLLVDCHQWQFVVLPEKKSGISHIHMDRDISYT